MNRAVKMKLLPGYAVCSGPPSLVRWHGIMAGIRGEIFVLSLLH
jgi:hypothetical protein